MNAITLDRRAERGVIVNGLSVDVEAWFQVGAFESVIERDEWSSLDDRVERNVNEILDLFDEVGAKATFFTLGWIAQRHGKILREIAARGHELASHGWDHQRVFRMGRSAFGADLDRARAAIAIRRAWRQYRTTITAGPMRRASRSSRWRGMG